MIFRILKLIGRLYWYAQFKADRLRLENKIRNGLKVGRNVYIQKNVSIDDRYSFLIEIGDNCRISDNVVILAHDATLFKELGVTKIAPVKILHDSFIGTRAIILPGVTIGPRAMIAAGSVVNRDIGEDMVAAGNPARPYRRFSDMVKKFAGLASNKKIFKEQEFSEDSEFRIKISRQLQKEPMTFIHGFPEEDPYYLNLDINRLESDIEMAFNRLKNNGSRRED